RSEDLPRSQPGTADERDKGPPRSMEPPAMSAYIVLRQGGKQRLRTAKADRAGGKIHIVGVFCTGGITLSALVTAERFKPLARLPAEQVLDGVKDRARMRF